VLPYTLPTLASILIEIFTRFTKTMIFRFDKDKSTSASHIDKSIHDILPSLTFHIPHIVMGVLGD
jgi:hypothetical protein